MSGYPQVNQGREGIGLVTGEFYPHSFTLDDLARFEAFVGEHERCVWYSDVAEEGLIENTIAVRHDVDHSIVHAVRFAEWEAEHGINSTYFILPTAPYWNREETREAALHIQGLGHEIGVHNDAMTEVGRRLIRARNESAVADEAYVKTLAIQLLADWAAGMREVGLRITGCADHGGGEPHNVDLWTGINARTPQDADISYEAYELHHRGANYISDNRGSWRAPLEKIAGKQTHVLVHPEHFRTP